MRVIIYNLDNPETKVTIANACDIKEAQRIMALFRKGNPDWKVNRRPNLDTWDNVVLTYTKD